MQKKDKQSVALRTFTAGQAAKAAGLAYHLVDYWAKTGLLVPSAPAHGSNTCRGYSFTDLVAMRVAAKLREAGVGSRELRKVVGYLQKIGYQNPLADAYLLVVHDGDVAVVEKSGLVSALKKPGQIYLVFALGEAVNELMDVASTLSPPTRGKAKLAVA